MVRHTAQRIWKDGALSQRRPPPPPLATAVELPSVSPPGSPLGCQSWGSHSSDRPPHSAVWRRLLTHCFSSTQVFSPSQRPATRLPRSRGSSPLAASPKSTAFQPQPFSFARDPPSLGLTFRLAFPGRCRRSRAPRAPSQHAARAARKRQLRVSFRRECEPARRRCV
eukprot:665428-Rhodomonas_salina.2